jgi:hypothetical protein
MKILFQEPIHPIGFNKDKGNLKKEEIITLINVFNKLSESISYYEMYLKMEADNKNRQQNGVNG